MEPAERERHQSVAHKSVRAVSSPRPIVVQRGPTPLSTPGEIVGQMGLSELRGIAREYDIVTNGMSKQQLAETILETLKQPEAVRRVAMTLEKPQRQLLAALTLAGGAMTDEDLRGLFERFALGQPSQFQATLAALQGKAMIFRTSLNSAPQQRIGLSGSLLDIGWYVPSEVRTALRVTVPITAFNMKQSEEGGSAPLIHRGEAYSLLADLLLVARALDNYQLTSDDEWPAQTSAAHQVEAQPLARPSTTLSTDGSVPLPPPSDMPSSSLLATLQTLVPRSPAFLRFAVRLLRLADLLHKDDSGAPYLRVLPNVAQLLLGPARADVARDLFELWLTQSSYEELFALQEDGLRLRCRATALNLPVMRSGELDAENNEARQMLVALLTQVPLNQWVSFPAFARFIYRLNPQFLQKRQRLFPSPHWWIEIEEGRPLRPLLLSDWLHAEVYYLARLLYGSLHWWGICDIALSSDGRLLAFRLTPFAGWLLSNIALDEAAEEPENRIPGGALEVAATGEIRLACSSQTWPAIELMETFAAPAGVRGGRLAYRLTARAVSEALSRGHRPAKLLELLHALAEQEAQQDGPLSRLVTQFEQWVASYGRVRIYTGVALLEAADNVVMRELSATTSVDEYRVQAIRPTSLVLNKPGVERIIDDLKRRGQSPLLHDEELYGAYGTE